MKIDEIDNIYLLCGGVSVEHEISILSAMNMINTLYDSYNIYPIFINKKGAWGCHGKITEKINNPEELYLEIIDDPAVSIGRFLYEDYRAGENNFFIPCLHGTYGEDGRIQGVLECLDVPYLGSDVLSSAICMDKAITNEILEYYNIPQARFLNIHRLYFKDNFEQIKEDTNKIGYPVFIKPSNAGSSVGVTKVEEESSLKDALIEAFKYDDMVLIEEAVIGREFEIAVMGNEFPVASLPGEHVIEGHTFFNYDSKYKDAKTVLMAPAEVDEKVEDGIRELAVKVYKLLGCSGLARVDIFYSNEGEFKVNEVNTFPGFTEHSLYPLLWEPSSDFTLKEVIEKLIGYGLDSFTDKKGKRRSI